MPWWFLKAQTFNRKGGRSIRRKLKEAHVGGPKVPKMACRGEVAPRSLKQRVKKLDVAVKGRIGLENLDQWLNMV